jgi:elongation factor 1 alpha-like protein
MCGFQVDWSEARFEEIVQQMQQFLTNAGFSLKNVTFIPMSGLTGINVARKPEEGAIPWYHGPTLLEVLGGPPAPQKFSIH